MSKTESQQACLASDPTLSDPKSSPQASHPCNSEAVAASKTNLTQCCVGQEVRLQPCASRRFQEWAACFELTMLPFNCCTQCLLQCF